ncbi:sodium:solute symporter family protein [Archaeoglobus neptunius]|uniref:sodium:solute symporter family protein n=1 Tax=Archaeoglobus neptunius TaxID=2798580 RepID=UPI001929110A|nr:sodium:solute symporter [Archaeoglobus neptunius]
MIVPLVVFGLYLAAIAVIAYVGARRTKTLADFIAASGQLGFWTYCLLMIGSVFSGMTLIGVAGLAFTTGWANVWERIIGPPFAIAFGTIIIGKKLFNLKSENGILTIQDYLAHRYDDPRVMRMLAGIISAITCFVYLIGQYTAIGVVSQIVLGIPYWAGAAIAAIIVVVYVMSGGMFSTAWTTFLQSLLMLLGIYLTVPIIISWVGGFEAMNQALVAMPEIQNATRGVAKDFLFAQYLSKPFAPANVPLAGWFYNLTLFGLTVPLGLMVAPHIVNNMLTFRKLSYTRWSPLVMYVVGFSAIMLTALAGMAARVAWARGMIEIPSLTLGAITVKWSDMAYPTIASKALPYWLFVLLLPTILAGVMSTTDRLILTAANNISYDVLRNAIGKKISDRTVKRVNMLIIPLIGFGSLVVALYPQQLLAWFVWAALSLMLNCFFFPIVLGLYWKKMSRNAARWSMVVGFVITITTFAVFGKTVFVAGIPSYSVLPGFIAALLTSLTISIIDGRS